MKSEKSLVGEAGEHLVCADLILRGRKATIVPGFVYDILVDEGGRFERIQVKTARRLHDRWQFAIGGAGNRRYGDDVDSFAYVFLGDGDPKIRYWKKPPTTLFKEIPA